MYLSFYIYLRNQRITMAKGGKHIVLAWLLIASLMPVHIVKALHFHNVTEDISSHSNIPHSHDPDNCCICQFFLSPFIESERIQTLFFRLLPLNVFHLKPKSVIPIYVLYLSELLLYILFSVDIIIKALITKACLTACINFIRVRFRCFFQGCFSVFTKLITSYLTSKNGKKTERKHKNDLI